MCRETDPLQLELEDQISGELLENGSGSSPGLTGEPLPSESDAGTDADGITPINGAGVRMVRRHQGLTDMSVSSLCLAEKLPGTFVALKREGLDGYTVMLSCALTSSEYASVISTLETMPSMLGRPVSVGVRFEPTTPNLVPPDTAPST